jgi:hypothetical protein
MIEKKFADALEPIIDAIVAVEKRVDSLQLTPGPAGDVGVPGKDGRDGLDADVELVAKRLAKEHAEVLRGLPGVDGKDGAPGKDASVYDVAKELVENYGDKLRGEPGLDGTNGIGIKSLVQDTDERLTIVLDDGAEVHVELPRGEKGDRGNDGSDGLGIEVKLWEPGVYREGTFTMANLGQFFKAVRDTASEPGKSADWARVGSFGFSWKGVKKDGVEYQDGDLYIDGGSTFLFINGKGRIFAQRGTPGQQGPAGKDGADAPHIVTGKFYENELSFVLSDGEIISADVEGLKTFWYGEFKKNMLDVLDAQHAARMARGAPLTEFRGYWSQSTEYAVGDVVTNNNATWVCVKEPVLGLFDADNWTKIASLSSGGGGAVTLRGLSDVSQRDAPSLGSVPTWTYVNTQTAAQGHWDFAKPTAHVKPWDGSTHWEGGATVIHHGQLWRAVFENTNVEPVMEDGKATLYMHIGGKPTFGLVPMGVSSSPPPAGFQDRPPSSWAFWLQYTDDKTMAIWEFVIKGKNPTTGKITGEWEGRPWMVIAHRGYNPPPDKTPPGIVIVWLYGNSTSTKPAVVGQQKWALVDLRSSLGMLNDVSVLAPKDGDILVYDGTEHKWKATSGSAWYLAMKAAHP